MIIINGFMEFCFYLESGNKMLGGFEGGKVGWKISGRILENFNRYC